MTASLEALLAGVLDYAGLFPPAQLSLAKAIHNYAYYRQQPERWMLGRFVCPAARLRELAPFVTELFSSGPPLAITALGRGGGSAAEFLAGLRSDLEAMAAFTAEHQERVELSAYEVRLPTLKDVSKLLNEAANLFMQAPLPSLPAYYEATLTNAWRASITRLTTALAELAARRLGSACPVDKRPARMAEAESAQPRGVTKPGLAKTPAPATQAQDPNRASPGFKLRCGGLDAAAFPSPEQVAFAITACRDAGVPLKFTAGLHHPLRHFDAALQTPMHGFLNVFVAGVLAQARQLSTEQVQRILEDERSEHFHFAVDQFRWQEQHANLAEIHAARQSAVLSFGSCSFEEPCADLRALGLLQTTPAGEHRS